MHLPPEFSDLAPYLDGWALSGDAARNAKRLASSAEELKAFHSALLPRIEAILDALDHLSIETLPDDMRRLFSLALSFCEVAPAVELFGQGAVIDGFEVDRFKQVSIPYMDPSDV